MRLFMVRRYVVAIALALAIACGSSSSAQWVGGKSGSQSVLKGFYTNFWRMEDLSDAIGSRTLTNDNVVTFSSGKIGNAGNFASASIQDLRISTTTFTGPSVTVSIWVKFSSAALNQGLVVWKGNGVGSFQVMAGGAQPGLVRFYTGVAGIVDSVATYNDNAYHLIVAYHDASNGHNVIIVDNGAPVTATGGPDVSGVAGLFNIGRHAGGGAYFSGQIDAVGIADNKVPTPAQISAMWNGGSGVERTN